MSIRARPVRLKVPEILLAFRPEQTNGAFLSYRGMKSEPSGPFPDMSNAKPISRQSQDPTNGPMGVANKRTPWPGRAWSPPGAAPKDTLATHGGGLLQTFGLDFRVAMLAVLVDVMAFSADVVSAGLLYPVEIGAALVLGVVTYKIQRAWYGDDGDSAVIKALVVALITAIPVPILPFLAGPAGLLGILRARRGKA